MKEKRLVYPWAKGLEVDDIVAFYDESGFKDWTHAETGAPVLKAQHPEFELWSQGIHARFIESENSTGFHAPQEAARVLGEAIDFCRKGQIAVGRLTAARGAPAGSPGAAPASAGSGG